METDDLLADDMRIRRPVFLKIVVPVVEQAECRAVIEQCVHPYVDDVARIEIHGDAPAEAGAGHAQILQTRLDEVVDHLVHTAGRLEEGAGLQQILHGFGVFGETEEIGLFLRVADFAAAVGAFAVHQLALGPETLAGCAVLALVGAFIDIALLIHLPEDPLDRSDMVIVGGADEAVVGDVHQLPQVQDPALAGDDVVHELLRGLSRFLCLFFDLLAVLIGPGEEHDVIAAQSLVAGDRIRRDGAVGVADVQLVGRIVDRGGDVKCFSVFHIFSLL